MFKRFIILFAFLSVLIFGVQPCNAVKITGMPEATSVTTDDLLEIVDSPSVTPTSKKITIINFAQSALANSYTFGSGSGWTWTFNSGAVTDPAFTFGSGTINVSAGTLQQGGVDVTTPSNTQTFTNKTYDSLGTGNVLKQKKYIVLMSPNNIGTGVTIQNTPTDVYCGQGKFGNATAKSTNYVEYRLTVPEDIDTSVDLIAERVKFRLGGADTGTHRYVLSMANVADSTSAGPTPGYEINCDFAGDSNGASGDIETVSNITLTNWRTSVTAGYYWIIRLARDGSSASDASTVDSYSMVVVISYKASQ